jgi:superfamily II DNA or RNA helicase
MNNEKTFGKIIFRKSYKEMIERNEILPIIIQTVDVSDYILLKNKSGAITEENKMDADFERDVASQSLAIIKSFEAHSQILRENSSQPESISPKLLVTVDGLAKLKGIISSSEFTQLRATGVKVMAISTELKYYNDGVVYEGYDFKEKFMKDIRMLKDEDKAIILHIDMISEGLDVAGITSVMVFSMQGTQKIIQLLGRAMRLHNIDRKNMYSGKFYKNMDRVKMMIKPYAYFIVPKFLRDSNDLMNNVREYVKQIHAAYDWIPETIYSQSQMIGDSQVLTNTQFTAKHDDYTSINFQHDIEADALLYLQDSYMPEVSL